MNGLKHDEEHEDIAEKRLLTPYELSHKRWAQHFQKQLEIRVSHTFVLAGVVVLHHRDLVSNALYFFLDGAVLLQL